MMMGPRSWPKKKCRMFQIEDAQVVEIIRAVVLRFVQLATLFAVVWVLSKDGFTPEEDSALDKIRNLTK